MIDGKKFDLRIYVGVTSWEPLRLYLYDDGLARFATHDYDKRVKKRILKDRFMHLTNYSVNRKSEDFIEPEDDATGDGREGSKWSMNSLWEYLNTERGVDVDRLRNEIKDLFVKTFIAAEGSIVPKGHRKGFQKHGACEVYDIITLTLTLTLIECEVYGVDVLIDDKFKPWLIEVDAMPVHYH